MEGACIYIDEFNNSTLLMYKEYCKNNIFFVYYSNYKTCYSYVSSILFTYIIPFNCIHILTKLPFDYYSIENTMNLWRIIINERLNGYNLKNKKSDFKNFFLIK